MKHCYTNVSRILTRRPTSQQTAEEILAKKKSVHWKHTSFIDKDTNMPHNRGFFCIPLI